MFLTFSVVFLSRPGVADTGETPIVLYSRKHFVIIHRNLRSETGDARAEMRMTDGYIVKNELDYPFHFTVKN
jgi:hypothetical protein